MPCRPGGLSLFPMLHSERRESTSESHPPNSILRLVNTHTHTHTKGKLTENFLLLFWFFVWFLRQGLMYPRLTSDSLCSQWWFWTSDPFTFNLQSAQIPSMHHYTWFVHWWDQSRALCKHSTTKLQPYPWTSWGRAALSLFKGIRSVLLTQGVFSTLYLFLPLLLPNIKGNLKRSFLT